MEAAAAEIIEKAGKVDILVNNAGVTRDNLLMRMSENEWDTVLNTNLKGAFKNYPFWLRSVAAHPSKVYPNRDFVFWQYSGTGLAASHDTRIDLNVFNGSEAGWHKWLASNRH